jgi:hypothetical protein
MSKCSKYGWRGHWFKNKEISLRDSENSTIIKMCACGISQHDEELASLKDRISNVSSSDLNIPSFLVKALPFVIAGVSLIIFMPLISTLFTNIFGVETDTSQCDENSEGYNLTGCNSAVVFNAIPKWPFFLMFFGFVSFFMLKMIRIGGYD